MFVLGCKWEDSVLVLCMAMGKGLIGGRGFNGSGLFLCLFLVRGGKRCFVLLEMEMMARSGRRDYLLWVVDIEVLVSLSWECGVLCNRLCE